MKTKVDPSLVAGAAAVLLSLSPVSAQVFTFNFSGLTGNEDSVAGIVAPSASEAVASVSLFRGPGLLNSPSVFKFSSRGWEGTTSGSAGGTSDEYFGISLSVNPGFTLSPTAFTGRFDVSGTGPGSLGMFYSGDSYAQRIGPVLELPSGETDFSFDLSSLGTLGAGAYQFRIYEIGNLSSQNFNATTLNGTLRFENPVSGLTGFGGSVAPIPEPGSAAMLLGLIASGVVALRRRVRA